jgi:type IV secretion system protein TrbJ
MVHPRSNEEIIMRTGIIKDTFAKLAVAFAIASPVVCNAQWIVFDPANFVRNTITSIQTVIDEINQIRQIEQLIKSNMAGLNIPGFSDLVAQANQIRSLVDSAQRLKTTIGNAQQSMTNIQAMYGAGNYRTWLEFGADIAKRKAAGDQVAINIMNAAEEADQQIVAASAAHAKIAASLNGVGGVTQAAQATGAAVGVLIQESKSMLALMSASAKLQGLAERRKTTEEEVAAKALADFQKRGKIEYDALMRRY